MQWATQQDWLLDLCGQCKLRTCPVQNDEEFQRANPAVALWTKRGLLSTDPTHLHGLAPTETVLAGAGLPWLCIDSAVLSKALEPSESLSDFSSIKWRPFLPHIVERTKSSGGWKSPGLTGSTLLVGLNPAVQQNLLGACEDAVGNADASGSGRFRPRSSSLYY